MAQQTAVQWLQRQLNENYEISEVDIEQALRMEKEQIEKTYNDAMKYMDYFTTPPSAEYYYKQTFKTPTDGK